MSYVNLVLLKKKILLWGNLSKMNNPMYPRFIDPEMQQLYESYIAQKLHWKRAEKRVLKECRRRYWADKYKVEKANEN